MLENPENKEKTHTVDIRVRASWNLDFGGYEIWSGSSHNL